MLFGIITSTSRRTGIFVTLRVTNHGKKLSAILFRLLFPTSNQIHPLLKIFFYPHLLCRIGIFQKFSKISIFSKVCNIG